MRFDRGAKMAKPAGFKRCIAGRFAVELPVLDGQESMAGALRVFLSAVTSEFGTARDAVANDLQARRLELRVQRSFRQEPGADTLLRLLHDYIRECDAVVCVIGARSGACPPPDAAGEFAHLLPPGTGRTGMRRAATISPNYRRPLSSTSRRRGCTTPGSPTATRCAPRYSKSRGPRNGGPNRSFSPIRASAACSKAAPRSSNGCARA